ncbi:GNAT family N-acetyltransferase [Agromyces sp. ISL-38]|uniref:GNAT family N-acetyltransferase n=1 Tax=Agromyces sp. ISL-38 TaxID=2819107 RepID=UPI001BE58C07|nr:GNAT family N-acetyltransferase [Agromyces sp. ISL-38]MBT2498046.1 GNAT family N-acetyltransferase [Agromyces sp. ISL-38]
MLPISTRPLVRRAILGGEDSAAVGRLVRAYLRQTEHEKAAHLPGALSDNDELPAGYRSEAENPDAAYAGSSVYLAELGSAVVGVAVLKKADGATEIKRLWADPGARGRGFGSALLDAVPINGFDFSGQRQDCGACNHGKVGAKRGWWQFASYSYRHEFTVASVSKRWNAKSVMDVFKSKPRQIFPFGVSGCSGFASGGVCQLKGSIPAEETAKVSVSTTPTSVTFTVLSNGYFDEPGSKITFSTFERDGFVYLQQQASANQANMFVAMGIDVGSEFVLTAQAQNLYNLLQ